jgi:hypothetical protein
VIDERIEELINADLDGRLNAGEHAELARAMLSDPDVRRLHDEMHRLQARLLEVGPAEPPPEFLDSVMAALPRQEKQAQQAQQAHDASVPGRRGWSWRHVAAMAAALGVVAVGLRLAEIGDRMDGSSAVGTMAVEGGSGAARIDRPEIEGSVRLRETRGSVYADLDVVPHDPLEVVMLQGGKIIGRLGLEPADVAASRKFSLELSGGSGAADPVIVRFFSGTRLVEEISLAVPAR